MDTNPIVGLLSTILQEHTLNLLPEYEHVLTQIGLHLTASSLGDQISKTGIM